MARKTPHRHRVMQPGGATSGARNYKIPICNRRTTVASEVTQQ